MPGGDENLVALLADRVPGGVDPAAEIKANFLSDIAYGKPVVDILPPELAIELLGAMGGGYNIPPLLACMEDAHLDPMAVRALSGCILAGDAVSEVEKMHKAGNALAGRLIETWAAGEWFASRPPVPECLRLVVYKVDGEVNTDDLSPAREVGTRPDIPLHALSMGATRFPGGRQAIEKMRRDAAATGFFPVFVADTLGTGSSRKSAVNSLMWALGDDIPHIPNIRRGGVVIATRIAPIFRTSFRDSGGLPIEADTGALRTGQKIVVRLDPAAGSGRIEDEGGAELCAFPFAAALADEWRAGGRINLIIGRKLTERAAAIIGKEPPALFDVAPVPVPEPGQGYTLAQKIVGRAAGKAGVLPGELCEPAISSVCSPDTTGPLTRDELVSLACLKFSAPMVMQSFCHTAAYPTDKDKAMHVSLAEFMRERGGVALKPGDGIIHSWINRLILPDRVGTGGDSHTRFPLGVSFPAGSGLIALAAAMGFLPVEMPESVLVEFSGALPEGMQLRDAVNAVPLFAMEEGLLDRPGQGNRNAFNGRVLEMEGMAGLTAEEGFELANASAERSAAAATVRLELPRVVEHIESCVRLIDSLLADGYRSADALAKRKTEMEEWLEKPSLLARDANARFAATLRVDLAKIREPIIACPNNPDNVAWLSERAGERVDEVFIGSCMTSVRHFRAAAKVFSGPGAHLGVKRLWIATPTRMDHDRLAQEGVLQCFEKLGARLEIPGCSLCMGNQARVADNAAVFSTSTRNFDNRMGAGARAYLGSAVLAAIVARTGRIPAAKEYFGLYRELVLPHWEEIGGPL